MNEREGKQMQQEREKEISTGQLHGGAEVTVAPANLPLLNQQMSITHVVFLSSKNRRPVNHRLGDRCQSEKGLSDWSSFSSRGGDTLHNELQKSSLSPLCHEATLRRSPGQVECKQAD